MAARALARRRSAFRARAGLARGRQERLALVQRRVGRDRLEQRVEDLADDAAPGLSAELAHQVVAVDLQVARRERGALARAPARRAP